MATSRTYRVQIEGEGLSLDQEVDQSIAVAVLNLVLGGVAAPNPDVGKPTGEGTGQTPPAGPSVRLSVGEFIAQVEAKRNPDKIVAMAVYLKEQGSMEFTADDIRPMFQSAGEPTPANFARDWRWAQNAKWIAPASGDPKAFYVTKTGEDAVKARFPADVRKATSQPVRKRSRKKAAGDAS